MLVLTREEGERIRLSDAAGNVLGWVCLVQVEKPYGFRPRARLGFEFPPGIKVLRGELLIPKRVKGGGA